MNLEKYFLVFKNSWQEKLTYRLDTLISFVVATITVISVFYLWNDVFQDRAVMAGYTREQMLTYYLLVGYFIAALYPELRISDGIRDGVISIFITKPIKYLGHVYAETLAKILFRLLAGLPVIVSIFVIFHDSLYIVNDFKAYIFLVITMLLAINILFLIDLIINFLEFWMTYADSLGVIIYPIMSFFSGIVLPLSFFPQSVQLIADYLPFKYTGSFLIVAFLGKMTTLEILFGIGIQIFWTLILFMVTIMVWRRGLKRHEAFGS